MDTAVEQGLTQAEAERRLERFGPNIQARAHRRSLWRILLDAIREPAFLLLIAAAALYLALGDLGEGLLLLAGAQASLALVLIQETRSERALEALGRLAEPQARVVRDGVQMLIPAREVVPGDLMIVGEGERIAADAALQSGDALTVDESILTGEAAPVAKQPVCGEASDSSLLFAGTLNVRGQGAATVLRTGADTSLGRIGASLASIKPEPTLLQKATGRLVAQMGLFALTTCVLVVLAYGMLRAQWVQGALSGLTLSISLIPEEYPMVLTVFLALGAWRMARRNVLVRRSAAIETLGAVSLLCVDKTGTLTRNRMEVAALWREGELWRPSEGPPDPPMAQLLSMASLGSSPRAVDPMDRAIRQLAQVHAPEEAPGEPLRAYPLHPDLLAFIQVWPEPKGAVLLAAKGAPEAISSLCGLDPEAHETIERRVEQLADEGLRVLGVASCRRDRDGEEPPRALTFRFEGLVGFLDPLREDAPKVIAQARGAGIQVMMITGDYPATAAVVARNAGVDQEGGVATGKEIAGLSPAALGELLRRTRVFARVSPEQKLALIQAAKANGEVVAMTGDGVNDAPALKAAHVGVAMGRRGTDVAREAADIVLLDDRLASVIGGVRLGRRIFANLRQALTFITAVHIPVAGLALLPILLGSPAILFPAHVVLLELVIDPVCSLVFESQPSARDVMDRPPRSAREPLFGSRQLLQGALQGVTVLGACFGLYLLSLLQHRPPEEARALAFACLVCGNLALALANAWEPTTRLLHPGRRLFWAIAALTLVITFGAIFVAPAARLLLFSPPDGAALIIAAAAGLAAGGWPAIWRRFGPDRGALTHEASRTA